MKTFLVLAAASSVLLASCMRESPSDVDVKEGRLTIRLSGVRPSSRAVEPAGETGQVTDASLVNGHIFVFTPLGAWFMDEALKLDEATTEQGQELSKPVPSDSKVYVVGNIPWGTTVSELFGTKPTLSKVKEALSLMTTQTDYTKPALANKDGVPTGIQERTPEDGGDEDEEVVFETIIKLYPLFSRLELHSLEAVANDAGDVITSFTITGVYVDNYYPSYTYGGYGDGTRFNNGTNTDFSEYTGFYKNESADPGWAAQWIEDEDGEEPELEPRLIATAGGSNVWAYNVASSPSGGENDVPRLFIRLTGIKYIPADAVGGGGEVRWNKASGASIVPLDELKANSYDRHIPRWRDVLYRIGSSTGNPFTFSLDDLSGTPNPSNVKLYVTVSVEDWELEDIDPKL